MDTPKEYKYITDVLKDHSLFSEVEFSENLYNLSRNNSYEDVERYKESILCLWYFLVAFNEVCDTILSITELLARHLEYGDELCNATPETGKKEVLTFLHNKGYKGDREIAFAAHVCSFPNNLDFLKWMYESETEWDDSLLFFDDIEDIKIIEFLDKNMENWKNGRFPTINIKKAK